MVHTCHHGIVDNTNAARNKQEIRAHGGITPLLAALSVNDIETRRYALRTICNLAINNDNKLDVFKAGGFTRVVELLSVPDQVIKRYGARCVGYGASIPEAAEEMIKANVLMPLIECMRSKYDAARMSIC